MCQSWMDDHTANEPCNLVPPRRSGMTFASDIDDFSRRPRPPIVLTLEHRERLLALKDSASEEMMDVVRFLMKELE
jgi:hypothetical protein